MGILLLCCLLQQRALGQVNPYVMNGSAAQNTCNCYTLTPQQLNESGSVWNKNKIDLTQSFDYHFNVFLGCNSGTNGADGIAFVLQPISTSIGTTGEGLGFGGVQPSLGVTIDTYQNTTDNDPSYDHIAFQANGDVNHADAANNLAGPIQALANKPNIKDCAWHVLEVQWNATTMTLSASMDGVSRLTMTKDIVQDIFQGNSMVFWGFTAATGGSDNLQQFCTSLNAHHTFAPDQHFCDNIPITFTDSSTSFGSIVSYMWNFGDGTYSTVANPPAHTYPTPAVYPVQEVVVGNNGCADTSNTNLIIGSYPVASFSVGAACTGQLLPLVNSSTDTVGTFAQWTWTLSGLSAQTFTDSLPSIVLHTPGAYNLQLSTVSAEGCASNTASGSFTVSTTPQVSFQGETVCAGTTLTLTGINGNNIPIAQWYWELGGSILGTTQSIQHVFTGADTATVFLWGISAQGCISDTFSQPIEIQATHASAGKDTAVALGYSIQLQASGGTYYTWSPPVYLDNPDIADPIATLPEDTRYTVTAYSTAGCPSSASILIKVYKGPAIYVPTAFTPNGDGANDVLKIVAPGISRLTYFQIYDRWGKEVFNTTSINATWDGTISGKPVPSGTYVWMIQGIDLQGAALARKGTLLLMR
jgi:gliding motility-associated-like protein